MAMQFRHSYGLEIEIEIELNFTEQHMYRLAMYLYIIFLRHFIDLFTMSNLEIAVL